MEPYRLNSTPTLLDADSLIGEEVTCGHDTEVSYLAWMTPFKEVVSICIPCSKRLVKVFNELK